MMLPKRLNYFAPPTLAPASGGLLGNSVRFAIDRTLPIEEILAVVDFQIGSTAWTLSGTNNILGILKKVNLTINDGGNPRSVVDCSGIGLLERMALVGGNLDSATLEAVALSQGATIPANQKISITYRIPMPHPRVKDPIETRMLLPVHLYNQDPVLTLDFESLATMASAGTISSVLCSIVLVRRVMPQSLSDAIQKQGGFIDFDILETPYTIAASIGGEQRFPLPIPGSYMDICFRQYLGGTTVVRNVLDSSAWTNGVVASGATNDLGNETRWRIESGSQVYSEWRWKQLFTINCFSRPLNGLQRIPSGFIAATSGGSPTVALGAATATGIAPIEPLYPTIGCGIPPAISSTGTSFVSASSTCLDFLTDGVGNGDPVGELGSLLDTNFANAKGLRMEIIGSVANVATNASTLFIVAQRILSPNLGQWQKIQ